MSSTFVHAFFRNALHREPGVRTEVRINAGEFRFLDCCHVVRERVWANPVRGAATRVTALEFYHTFHITSSELLSEPLVSTFPSFPEPAFTGFSGGFFKGSVSFGTTGAPVTIVVAFPGRSACVAARSFR